MVYYIVNTTIQTEFFHPSFINLKTVQMNIGIYVSNIIICKCSIYIKICDFLNDYIKGIKTSKTDPSPKVD